MNRSFEEEEVNYWPSISDMFLVFFVLALTIVASSSTMTEEGDKYALRDVWEESNRLLERQGIPTVAEPRDWDEPEDAFYSGLSARLKEAKENLEQQGSFVRTADSNNDAKAETDDSTPAKAVHVDIHELARSVGIEKWYIRRYDKLMREVNAKVNERMGSSLPPASTDKDLLQHLDKELSRLCGIQAEKPSADSQQIAEHAKLAMEQINGKLTDTDSEKLKELKQLILKKLNNGSGNGAFPSEGTTAEQLETLVGKLISVLNKTQIELKNARPVKTVIDDRILYFDTNKARPLIRKGKEAVYREALADVAASAHELIRQGHHVTIEIYGHTDDSFTEDTDGQKYNAWLGLERARAMQKEIMQQCDLSEKDVTIHAYSASYHIPTGQSKEDCRRIEVRILPTIEEPTER